MNIAKKAFCRVFQKVMHLLIPIFPYREPKILDSTEQIADLLKSNNIERVMLVTDKGIRGLGLCAPLENHLEKNGIACHVYDETVPNPTSQNVEDALKIYKANSCQALIAFGGGSSMDCAKALGARVVCPNKSLDKMAGLIKICKRLPMLIAIPTTAGTGSEATVASVIVDSKTHHKYVINDFCLIPRYAVLDPKITVGLPPHLTATTGMDALTHAIEAYIGRSKTKVTKAASIDAVKLIFDNLERAYENGADLDARKNMLHASYLAGVAFTRSYVGYVHAVAHTLGGKYGVAHGLANAVLLPCVLRAYGESATDSLAELARAVGLVNAETSAEDAAEAIISHIEGMNERMNIPKKLSCIKSCDIPEMAKLADREANPIYPVPTLWNAEELEAIYCLVCDEIDDQ
jgi:alcohol dehydrogenase class IV